MAELVALETVDTFKESSHGNLRLRRQRLCRSIAKGARCGATNSWGFRERMTSGVARNCGRRLFRRMTGAWSCGRPCAYFPKGSLEVSHTATV